jgi:acetyl esterase
MVAISADYRVSSSNGTKAWDSVRDAKSAIRWVRWNADRLDIDPGRIAAAGGSASGHIAAVAGIAPGLDEPTEDRRISSRPNALVLFNPVLILARVGGRALKQFDNPELQGGDRQAISPYHHVAKGAPPTVIFHGKADVSVPYATAEMFVSRRT